MNFNSRRPVERRSRRLNSAAASVVRSVNYWPQRKYRERFVATTLGLSPIVDSGQLRRKEKEKRTMDLGPLSVWTIAIITEIAPKKKKGKSLLLRGGQVKEVASSREIIRLGDSPGQRRKRTHKLPPTHQEKSRTDRQPGSP